MAAPFLFTLASLFLYDDADERGDSLLALWPLLLILAAAMAIANLFRLRRELSLRAFLPLVLLAAIHGTFMSQQLWGSTYAHLAVARAAGGGDARFPWRISTADRRASRAAVVSCPRSQRSSPSRC